MVESTRNIPHNLIHSITIIVLRTKVMVGAIRNLFRNIIHNAIHNLIRNTLRVRAMVECIHSTITIPCTELWVFRFPVVVVVSLSQDRRVESIALAAA